MASRHDGRLPRLELNAFLYFVCIFLSVLDRSVEVMNDRLLGTRREAKSI